MALPGVENDGSDAVTKLPDTHAGARILLVEDNLVCRELALI